MRLIELKENILMALNAITAHKLRSALTLLGVLVGVFSIIVVMTAVRVMQSNIESQLSQLGANSFQIRKYPGAFFGVKDFEKFIHRF
jgi:putative ABC transport system permease protein